MEDKFITKTLLPEYGGAFKVTHLKVESSVRCVLFAAGLGGDPLRHKGLLRCFAAHGMSIVAPHFEMLSSSIPTKAELLERSRRLALAMHAHCTPGTFVAGVGHSIGTVILLMQAGGEISTLEGDRITFNEERILDRLVLLAPPTDFFRRPGSLMFVNIPIQIWVGGRDTVTPPSQSEFLKEAISEQTKIDLHIIDNAGHFTFMNELPPNVADTHPNRNDFISYLGDEASRFLLT